MGGEDPRTDCGKRDAAVATEYRHTLTGAIYIVFSRLQGDATSGEPIAELAKAVALRSLPLDKAVREAVVLLLGDDDAKR